MFMNTCRFCLFFGKIIGICTLCVERHDAIEIFVVLQVKSLKFPSFFQKVRYFLKIQILIISKKFKFMNSVKILKSISHR